ncbi:LysE family translocator [Pseudohalocynthiibacter sp. F2068]|jgi:threonine/homoserine/homoserine lactone efflux protein|uniref:LysE family translocator n=1 Tax=Pseudohalocynthiibacter sp. F2068 TaxID=2926418 RepID=UPI001FF6E3A0|nr:LysE family translocator [Pseudohalocynthiibacter sp. F2068]MCK0103437.1 LysE family translocator [Pseudohalocynthiibacter sp. F2068]
MTQAYAMALFALTMSISPGPVNLITLSTGVNHGVRKAFGFVSGATIGFTLLLLLLGLGLQVIAEKMGVLLDILTILGAALIIYFGYKLVTSDGQIDAVDHAAPSFWQGAALQWMNPKAWGACIAAVSVFNLESSRPDLFFFVVLYCIICFFGIGSWAVFGSQIERFLDTLRRRIIFNAVLGIILIVLACLLVVQKFLIGS